MYVGQERKKACSNKKLEICSQHLLKMTSIIMFSVLFKVPIFLKDTRKDKIRLTDKLFCNLQRQRKEKVLMA